MSKTRKGVSAELQKEEVLQALVLADDFTADLTPTQDIYPSILVPVVSVPLLDYLTEALVKSGIQELFLYCSNHIELLRKYVQSKNFKDIVVNLVISDGCRSLGDALRDIDTKGLIRGDFVLIRGDVFTNANLKNLLNAHRSRNKKDKGAAMSLVFRDLGSTDTESLREESSIVVANGSTNRVLFYKKLGKADKKIKLELEWFLDHDRVGIHGNLLDTHIYLCSPSVLPLFSDNFDFQTMEDFIRGVLINEEILDSRIYWQRLDSDEYALPVTSWRAYHMLSREIMQRQGYPLTPNTIPNPKNFVYLRRSTYKHRSATLAKGCTLQRDSVIGPNSKLGENTFITKSIIGEGCTLGKSVRVENSYIFANVEIRHDCIVKNSVILPDCILENSVAIDGCILSQGVRIDSKRVYTDSILEARAKDVTETELCKANPETNECLLYFKYDDLVSSDIESSDTDDSSSEDGSLSGSPIPDDTNMFLTEVIDSLLRGYQDKLNCENLILEINSSRYAYNVTIQEVTYNVVKAILSLPLHHLSETKDKVTIASYQKTLKTMMTYFHAIFVNYVKTEEAQEDCLRAIEDVATTTQELLSFVQHLLHHFYERDILAEEKIFDWYRCIGENEEEVHSKEVRRVVEPFIKWLQEAEEDSSADDSD